MPPWAWKAWGGGGLHHPVAFLAQGWCHTMGNQSQRAGVGPTFLVCVRRQEGHPTVCECDWGDHACLLSAAVLRCCVDTGLVCSSRVKSYVYYWVKVLAQGPPSRTQVVRIPAYKNAVGKRSPCFPVLRRCRVVLLPHYKGPLVRPCQARLKS